MLNGKHIKLALGAAVRAVHHRVDERSGSARVRKRLGMQQGVLRQVMFLPGRYTAPHLYAVTRGDWQSDPDYRRRFEFLRHLQEDRS